MQIDKLHIFVNEWNSDEMLLNLWLISESI